MSEVERAREDGTPHRGLDIRGRLLARNTLLNLVGQLTPVVVVILAAPFLIGRLGEDRSGILGVGLAILNFSSLFDLGLGRAVRRRVSEVLGIGARERVPAIATTAVVAQIGSGAAGSLLVAAVTPLAVGRLLQIPPSLHDEARVTLYLIAIGIPLSILIDSLAGVLEAAQRFDLVNAVRAPFILSSALLPLVGVHLGWALPGIAALQLGAAAFFLLLHLALCLWVFPNLVHRPRVDRVELRRLLGFGGWVIVSNALAPALMYLDRLAIGVVVGMSAVTAYTAPFEMITRLSLVPASLAATLFPAFSALSRQGRDELLTRYASRSVRYLLYVLGPVVLITMIFSRPILELWLGPELAKQGAVALAILAFGVLVNALAHVPFAVLHARGRPDLTALFHLIELPILAGAVFVFVRLWGISGAAAAWTLRVTLDGALLFWATARLVPQKAATATAGATIAER